MRFLIGWDNPTEADLLRLYLGVGDNEAEVALGGDELFKRVAAENWDALFLALTFPATADEGLATFSKVRQELPGVPIVLACRETEMMSLPRFLTRGLRHYLMRDSGGNFVFLAMSALETAIAAARAEEMERLNQRLREEMEGVRKLQQAIIPSTLPVPPGYRIAARYEPSEVRVVGDRPVVMAGGDYYDVFRPDDRNLVVLLGDASGHGLKACMAIMTMHTLIRMIPGDHFRDTAAFVTEINKRLCDNSIVQSEGGFITLFYAAIDTTTHTMRWASAGHPLPMLQRLDTGELRPIGTDADGGMPLAIVSEADYTAAEVLLEPGTRVALFTDGLTDAFPIEGSARNAFGIGGIRSAMDASRARPVDEALQHLMEASHQFTAGSGRHDDTTVVLVERSA